MSLRQGIQALRLVALSFVLARIGIAQDSRDLSVETSSHFSGSGNCIFCHSTDGVALTDSTGQDLSPATDWRSTMMANSARDPLWQAKVESEVAEHPELAAEIETTCTRCHAPAAHEQAMRDGDSSFRLEDVLASELALDGVTCTVCHQISAQGLGTDSTFSGGFRIEGNRTIFGPYREPFARPMTQHVNYTPAFGEHMNRSELCASCHTLFTSPLGENVDTTDSFPEQVPYLEWTNSVYPSRGIECQSCHMPRLDEGVKISDRPHRLTARSPFWKHHFVGGNAFMLEMLRDNAAEIGVTASRAQLDATIARTREQLREQSVDLDAKVALAAGALEISVRVLNRAGHKFPTGFPSRRAWLHVRVRGDDGETIFESGAVDASGRIEGVTTWPQPHRDTITRPQEVQIWESVMGDLEGKPTFSLLEAVSYRKDNRIPPEGFVIDAPRYEDMAIVGAASSDANFNREGDQEGSGADRVRYRVAAPEGAGTLGVLVELLYQSVSPSFVDDLLTHETDAVARFRRHDETSRREPELVARVELDVPPPGVSFRRGDINADGHADVSDAVFALLSLFGGGDGPSCARAADLQPDSAFDVADAIYLLSHLFLGGVPPAAPFEACGPGELDESLSCESFAPCEI